MSRSLCVVLVLLCLAAPAAAQTTRTETIAEQQAEKAKTLEPEGPSRAEQIGVRITSSFGRVPEGPYPWFGTIFPGGSFALGAAYGRTLAPGRLVLTSAMSIEAYKLLSAEFTPRDLARGRVQTSMGAEWIDAPDVAFYGLGPDSIRHRSAYGYQPTTLRASGTAQPVRFVEVSGAYNFLHTSTDEGKDIAGRFTPAQTPGLNTSLNYNVTSGSVAFDTRPNKGYSTHGMMVKGTWWRYDERDRRPYSFSRTEYESGVLIPLVREQFGFMLRGVATVSHPDEGEQVPIMLASEIGSGRTVRGFHNRRFQDDARVFINAEYRWRPSRYLDMALFMDMGQVAPRLKDVRFDTLEHGWGIGSRFHGPSFMVLRIEVAKVRSGMNLIVSTSQPF